MKMKQLYLMRHASAESHSGNVPDKQRILSFQGKGELERLQVKLLGLFDGVSLVLCSNSMRTRQTLEGIQNLIPPSAEVKFLDELYHCQPVTILEELSLVPEHHSSILIIGHNPGISQFLNDVRIASGQPSNGSIPPAAVTVYSFNTHPWAGIVPAKLKFEKLILA
jgi:phosphohistidine phosphatase